MPIIREYYLGAIFSVKEKEYIQNFTEKRKMTLNDLIRESVFSYLNHLEKNEGKFETKEPIRITEELSSVDE
ncbi:MAG: hypothetical protein ACFFDN_44870 [Candidatus Hodarchaeota archaeon]